MKNKLYILYSIIILTAVACSSSTGPDIDNTLPVVKPTETTELPIAPGTPVSVEPTIQLPQATPSNKVALNPPHGQPGHDCNVAVGSPLNGAANSFNAPPQAPMPVMPSAVNPVNNVSTSGAKLNPPHGQPGHDCNIQVGQPLSS